MEFDNFYIDLSSNVKSTIHGTNTIANFITQLNKRYSLIGKWEVALVEIAYHKSWYNVKENARIELFDLDNNVVSSLKDIRLKKRNSGTEEDLQELQKLKDKFRDGVLKAGYYESASTLIREINKQLEAFPNSNKTHPKLHYNSINQKVTISPGEPLSNDMPDKVEAKTFYYPDLGNELEQMLGLVDENNKCLRHHVHKSKKMGVYNSEVIKTMKKQKYKGSRAIDLSGGIHSLYVYCDLVYPQLVADTRVQLLQCVEIPNNTNFGDQVVIKYPSPHYLPVMSNEFHCIQIDIKDDTNTRIPFQIGRTRLKLHFRKNE